MFKVTKAISSFSVDSLAKAKKFYSEKLGLNVSEEPQMKGMFYLNINNDSKVMLYEKPNHTPATFTVLNFPVKDVESTVDDLAGKGIRFEQYDELKTDKKGISAGGPVKIAWFKDPAGNIISVVEEK
jgi:predicted enzyme related to lactoylglutathione lyase